MQIHKSQQFRNVLQNPVDPEPIFAWLLSAAHSWFNQVNSLFGVKKKTTQVYTVYTGLPSDANSAFRNTLQEIVSLAGLVMDLAVLVFFCDFV